MMVCFYVDVNIYEITMLPKHIERAPGKNENNMVMTTKTFKINVKPVEGA
jgi:hypothetical protein